MIKNILVSIIIPVYNSEKYIKECVESILSQSYSNLEIILINDASEDQSEKICMEIAHDDSRVCVVSHQKNLGVSWARESGVKIANGQLVFFIDNDDIIETDLFELVLNEYDDEDIVALYGVDANERRILDLKGAPPQNSKFVSKLYSGQEFADMVYKGEKTAKVILGPLWGKLYKKTFLIEQMENVLKHKDRFQQVYMEDVMWGPILYSSATSVKVIPLVKYYHRVNIGLSYRKKPSDYHYQGAYSLNVINPYIERTFDRKTYENILINDFLLYISLWYKSWRYENDKAKFEKYDNYVKEMYTKYISIIRGIKVKGVKNKLKKYTILVFNKHKKMWSYTVGKIYFR